MSLKDMIRGRTGGVAGAVAAVPAGVESAPEAGRRLDPADCLVLIREAFDPVKSEYVGGALGLLDTDPDLFRRFQDTEAAIDATVRAGPTESELRAALAAHVGVIRECVERKRAWL